MFTEMVAGIEMRLLEGGEKGKIPKYSITDLDKNYFRFVTLIHILILRAQQ